MPHMNGAVLKPLVELGKTPEDCWQWLGHCDQAGYGKKQFGNETWVAHRWLWCQLFGPIPDGLVIDHICQNTSCVNPHHLRVVTQAENVRAGIGTLLTSRDVAEIRRLSEADWTPAQLAQKFCAHPGTIKSLLAGKSWRRTAKKFYGPRKSAAA